MVLETQKIKEKEITITLFVGEEPTIMEKYLIKDQMKNILGRKYRRCMF